MLCLYVLLFFAATLPAVVTNSTSSVLKERNNSPELLLTITVLLVSMSLNTFKPSTSAGFFFSSAVNKVLIKFWETTYMSSISTIHSSITQNPSLIFGIFDMNTLWIDKGLSNLFYAKSRSKHNLSNTLICDNFFILSRSIH